MELIGVKCKGEKLCIQMQFTKSQLMIVKERLLKIYKYIR